MLQQQGKDDQVDQAKQELLDQVDTDQHSDLLQKFGLNPRSCSPSSAATSLGSDDLRTTGPEALGLGPDHL